MWALPFGSLAGLVCLALSAGASPETGQPVELRAGVAMEIVPPHGVAIPIGGGDFLPPLQGSFLVRASLPAFALHPSRDGAAIAGGMGSDGLGLRAILDGALRGLPAAPVRVDPERLDFELPVDLGTPDREVTLELVLLWKEGWLRHSDTLLRATLRPVDDSVRVVRVTRYPSLHWHDCPNPCTRRPPVLTPEEWTSMIEVHEDGVRQPPDAIRLVAEVNEERPFTAVMAMDVSGSTYQTRSGDAARAILDYFAAFPDEAYGDDEVRAADRLAVLYFADAVRGYYRPAEDRGRMPSLADSISREPHFVSPADLAPTWSDYCRSPRGGRFDEAWLLGLAVSIEDLGLGNGFVSVTPRERMCDYLRAPEKALTPRALESCGRTGGLDACLAGHLLDQLRAGFQRTLDQGRLGRSLPTRTTDVAEAISAGGAALARLLAGVDAPPGLRENQQAVILVSDGLDHDFLTLLAAGDEAGRRQRLLGLEDGLGDRRFFFVEISSEATLGETAVRSLARRYPLLKIFIEGIDRHVAGANAANLLIRGLADEDLRPRLETEMTPSVLEDVVADPALRTALRRFVAGEEDLHGALTRAIEEALSPQAARETLTGRAAQPAPAGLPAGWLDHAAAMAARWHEQLARKPARAEYERLYRRIDAAAAQFRALARSQSGVAVSAHDCRLAEAPELPGAACAFRTIRDILRRGIRVTWAPMRFADRGGARVHIELRLTEEGSARLADLGYRDAGLDFADSWRAALGDRP